MLSFIPRVRAALASIAGLFRSRMFRARLEEEMQLHVELAAERNRRVGMTADDALREAHAAFGGRERVREETRDEFRSRPLDDLFKDVHYALRSIRRRPAFSLILIVTLALGIGAFTTVFSVVNGVLFQPLPYRTPDRLVTLWQRWQQRPGGPWSISPAEYFDYADQLTAFDAFGVYNTGTISLLGDGDAVRLPYGGVSAGVLTALGTKPLLGRLITADDTRPDANDVVVLNETLWKNRFGGDSSLIGRTVSLNGAPATVIGVVPSMFRLPDQMSAPDAAQLLVPLVLSRDRITIRGSHYLSAVARLRPGVSVAQGNADVATMAQRMFDKWPNDYPAASVFGASAIPLRTSVVGDTQGALLLLLGAVFLVLLIACVNAASLLLARSDSRRAEIAIRTAMGAARTRLVRQLLVESLVLAAIAGTAGILFAFVATRAFVAWHPIALPRLAEAGVNGSVLAFALLVTVIAAIAFGLAPALQLVAQDVQATLRSAGRGATTGRRRQRARRMLVAAEIAIAVVLLLGTGLVMKSLGRLLSVDPGFVVDHALTVSLTPPRGVYDTDDKLIAFYHELGDRIRALPGVRAAGAVAGVPLVAPRGDIGIEFEGHPVPPGAPHPKADWQVVTPGYFGAIGMHMVQGREISAGDVATVPGVVVVNATMAKRFWPAGDAIGKRFKLGGGARPDTATVIGIVADVRQSGLAQTPEPEMYLAYDQFRFWGGGGMLFATTLVVRTEGDPASFTSAVRSAIRDMAPSVPVGAFRTMEELRGASIAEPRFAMFLLAFAATAAFVIAVVGLYGIVAYSVTQRRKEFGVRIALGAQRLDLTRMVIGESMTIAALGIAVGVAVAIAAGRLLQRFLFHVSPADPTLFVLIPASLAAVALFAAYIPARRAANSDPMRALRTD